MLDAIESVGISLGLKDKLARREKRQAELKFEIASLRRTLQKTSEAPPISEGFIDKWIDHIRAALTSADDEDARLALRQFVEKVV